MTLDKTHPPVAVSPLWGALTKQTGVKMQSYLDIIRIVKPRVYI